MAPSVSRAWTTLEPQLSAWTLEAVSSMGFERMTPVQASTIPLFMSHKDVVVEAVTGSGKTLSFLIPIVERLLHTEEPTKRHHVGAIIVSPTRELATQIHGVLRSLLCYHAPSASRLQGIEQNEDADLSDMTPSLGERHVVPQLLVGGGCSPSQDLANFVANSPNILVATPGRLLELLSSRHVKCPQSSFEVLVLDEADRLLDMGFKDDLQKILGKLPKQRRTGLFSASVSEAVDQLVRVGLRNPVKVVVKVKGTSGKEDQRTPASLEMRYLVTPASHKLPMLHQLLATLDPKPAKVMVYLSTCAAVDYFQHVLPQALDTQTIGYNLVPLHGKHPPNVREKNFAKFTNSASPSILLTTDVAARGLDIPQVDLVVQLDPPSDPKVFLHRCGRAGRAGRKGLAIVFLHDGREQDYVHFLEVRKTPVKLLETPPIHIEPSEPDTFADRIRKQVLMDRALHDKAQRAFVSWLKSYSKHQAGSIFRVSELDWHDLAKAWGLLKLPKMPEAKQYTGDKGLGLGVNFDTYSYKDNQREKARLASEAEAAANGPTPRVSKKRAWSEKLDRKDERDRQRSKRHRQREKEKWANMSGSERKEQMELEDLIGQVKSQSQVNDDEFEGFD